MQSFLESPGPYQMGRIYVCHSVARNKDFANIEAQVDMWIHCTVVKRRTYQNIVSKQKIV